MGIRVGIKGQEGPIPEAYFGIAPGSIQGDAKVGWRCQFRAFASKEAKDAGAPPLVLPLLPITISVPGTDGNQPGGPGIMGGANAPAALDPSVPVVDTKEAQYNPYIPLYAKFMLVYPKAERCD